MIYKSGNIYISYINCDFLCEKCFKKLWIKNVIQVNRCKNCDDKLTNYEKLYMYENNNIKRIYPHFPLKKIYCYQTFSFDCGYICCNCIIKYKRPFIEYKKNLNIWDITKIKSDENNIRLIEEDMYQKICPIGKQF